MIKAVFDTNVYISAFVIGGRAEQAAVPVVMLTHEATEGDMQKALKRINHLDVVAQDTICIRVEGAED